MSAVSYLSRTIPARLIVAGDFTRFNGFRWVVSVEHIWSTEGRGNGRASNFTKVLLHRSDDTVDELTPYAELSVRRETWPS